MDTIEKALKKLTPKQRKQFKQLLLLIRSGEYHTMDVKKLKGYDDIFRVRKGTMRIIFQIKKKDKISILSLETRSEKTYKRF